MALAPVAGVVGAAVGPTVRRLASDRLALLSPTCASRPLSPGIPHILPRAGRAVQPGWHPPHTPQSRAAPFPTPCWPPSTTAQGRSFVAGAGEASRGALEQGAALVLYSKARCCLCDGLKEKISTVLELAPITGNPILTGLPLEVRDITTNPDWFGQYQYEIPVLASLRRNADGSLSEVAIPRQSPRVSLDRLQKVLEEAFS